MTTSNDGARALNRMVLRSAFQSLFWHVLITRKREGGLTLKKLADKLGINKSYVTRSFSAPPNWQIDKISDFSDALNVDVLIYARDRGTGKIYSPSGDVRPITSTEVVMPAGQPKPTAQTYDGTWYEGRA